MSARRRSHIGRPPPPREELEPGEDARLDLVMTESEEELEGWSRGDRQLFAELLEDAASELQRELLRRALAAGHPPEELHAFADAIRSLSDRELFSACTLSPEQAAREPVEDRLRAEADPLHAYELNGGELTPRAVARPAERAPVRLPPGMMVESSPVPVVPRKDRPNLAEAPAPRPQGKAFQPGAGRFAEDLFNEAGAPLGLSFVEQAVDGRAAPLELVLPLAADALLNGIPVPVLLGATEGDWRRYALLLQVQLSGGSRVFQLHVPFEHDTAWVHERDFLARVELPLSDKALRRITAIALPVTGGR